MIETFDDLYGLNRDELKPEELEAAWNLVRTKFATREWIYLIP
ncbi:hypothetical protein [Meiothermus sp. Pnk-1]|nr:hypothetical protein [Meiothermus sp. Pnk-1]